MSLPVKSRARLLNHIYPLWVVLILAVTGTVLAQQPDLPYTTFLPSIGMAAWTTSFVDSPRYFSDLGARAFAFRSPSHPCAVYGNDHLYYACWDGRRWDIQVIDPENGVGRFATLVIQSGIPHIAYYDESAGILRYATGNGSTWRIEKVTQVPPQTGPPFQAEVDISPGMDLPQTFSPGEPLFGLVSNKQGMGGYASLAVDSQGRPHVSFYDFDARDLWYGVRVGETWQLEKVDEAGDVGLYTSLALSSGGLPSIAYYDGSGKNLKLASRSAGGMWSLSLIDSAGDVGQYASLALDPQNRPRIAYYDATNHRLRYWQQESGAQSLVFNGLTLGMFASLRLNDQNQPWISTFDESHSNLVLVRRNSTGWVSEMVDSVDVTGRFGSLAIDSSGRGGMVYYHSSNCELRYAERSSEGDFTLRRIDTNTITGIYSLMAVTGNQPHIVYLNDTQSRLMYAYLQDGVWTREVISDWNDTGVHPSLALDSSQADHVTFWQYHGGTPDGILSSLRHTVRSGGGWSSFEVVDEGIGIGFYSSLAVGPLGTLHASYYDEDNGNLKYARKSGGLWSTQTVDSAGNVGSYTDLAVDPSGTVWISYYDVTNSMVKVARRNGTAWQVWRMDWGGATASESAVAVGQDGIPHVLFRDLNTGLLQHAYYQNNAWSVENTQIYGRAPSPQMVHGRLFFSFYDDAGYNLGFARKLNASWEVEMVDLGGDVGMFNTLVFGSDNVFRIAYLDATNGDLKYAYRAVMVP